MAALRQLSKEDVLFVAGETETVYQHTAGLAILDTSTARDFNFETFRERIIERIREVPHFHWKLQEVPLKLDLPYWVEDKKFDYKHHFKRIAVPSPGDREALAELVAHLYSKHMDRSKPLWELWLIEGLADGRYAMLQKSHHCMMDGEGANQLSKILCDLEPGAAPTPVDDAIAGARVGDAPSRWRMTANTTIHLARLPASVSRGVVGFLSPKLLKKLGLGKTAGPDKLTAPATCFNGDIGSERGFVYGALALADVKVVKKAFGVSVNDVILGLVGSSMRNYLLAHRELPDASLRTSIMVSLRTEEDDSFSNRVTNTSLTLATDVKDPVARLRAINQESGQVKQQAKEGGIGIAEIIQLMPPLMVKVMASASSADMARQMLGANLIVSNVRSSSVPLYIAGAQVEALHPMSIITQGIGINITCVSYADTVGFGVTIDPELVPQPWNIVDGLSVALQEYVALAKKAERQSKAAARKKRPVKKKAAANKT